MEGGAAKLSKSLPLQKGTPIPSLTQVLQSGSREDGNPRSHILDYLGLTGLRNNALKETDKTMLLKATYLNELSGAVQAMKIFSSEMEEVVEAYHELKKEDHGTVMLEKKRLLAKHVNHHLKKCDETIRSFKRIRLHDPLSTDNLEDVEHVNFLQSFISKKPITLPDKIYNTSGKLESPFPYSYAKWKDEKFGDLDTTTNQEMYDIFDTYRVGRGELRMQTLKKRSVLLRRTRVNIIYNHEYVERTDTKNVDLRNIEWIFMLSGNFHHSVDPNRLEKAMVLDDMLQELQSTLKELIIEDDDPSIELSSTQTGGAALQHPSLFHTTGQTTRKRMQNCTIM